MVIKDSSQKLYEFIKDNIGLQNIICLPTYSPNGFFISYYFIKISNSDSQFKSSIIAIVIEFEKRTKEEHIKIVELLDLKYRALFSNLIAEYKEKVNFVEIKFNLRHLS